MDRVLAAIVVSIIVATFASAAALEAFRPEQKLTVNITAREIIVEGSVSLTSGKALREYRYRELVLIIPPVTRVQLNVSLAASKGGAGTLIVDCPRAQLIVDRIPIRALSVGDSVLVQFASLPHLELSSLNPSIDVDLIIRIPSGALVQGSVGGNPLPPGASVIIRGFRCTTSTPPVVVDFERGLVYGEPLRVEVAGAAGVKVYEYKGRLVDPLILALSSVLGAVIVAVLYEYLKSKHVF